MKKKASLRLHEGTLPMQPYFAGWGQHLRAQPFRSQLLKWVGNKQKIAAEIVSYFPLHFGAYYEPFLGSGGVLATLAPSRAIGSDKFAPLMEIWKSLQTSPDTLKQWYADRYAKIGNDKVKCYETIKASYNANPNGADLLFLSRSCYGGVVRFRQADGYMSTPCGVHQPISPESFARRVDEWHRRTRGTSFEHLDYEKAIERAQPGDLVYCDPPYSYSQAILYGAQSFSLAQLLTVIARCKARGVYVALSIDGKKKSGQIVTDLSLPDGLFEREVFVNLGGSMLRRFQMGGQSLEAERVADRLLLTY